MTYNQIITELQTISLANPFVKFFGTGELWEVEGNLKPAMDNLIVWAAPVTSTVEDNQNLRTFNLLCMGRPHKDKSDEQEVLSDSEAVLKDIIKALRFSDNYDIQGTVTLTPFKEDFGDWLTGWNAEITIVSDESNNPCDIPE